MSETLTLARAIAWAKQTELDIPKLVQPEIEAHFAVLLYNEIERLREENLKLRVEGGAMSNLFFNMAQSDRYTESDKWMFASQYNHWDKVITPGPFQRTTPRPPAQEADHA